MPTTFFYSLQNVYGMLSSFSSFSFLYSTVAKEVVLSFLLILRKSQNRKTLQGTISGEYSGGCGVITSQFCQKILELGIGSMALSSFSDFYFISSTVTKRSPFMFCFVLGKKKEETVNGAIRWRISGEYGGCGIIMVLFLTKTSCTSNDV